MSTARGVIAIPARMASTRLPNKLLLSDTGKPLLAHVIERSVEAIKLSTGLLVEVLVACDDDRLVAVARRAGVRAVLTSHDHRCGTTRIAEAIESSSFPNPIDFVVNVQGDEPELAPEAIVRVAQELLARPGIDMATLAMAISSDHPEQKANPNLVKVVFDADGRALYFSRAPIPYGRNLPATNEEPIGYHHLGIYAYRRDFLLGFDSLPPSALEQREGLEQLRALAAGRTIQVGVIPAHWAGKGIDTPADYAAFVGRQAA